MKIVTVTYSRSYNYGANLQAYALQKFLRDMGHECKIIDTRKQVHRKVTYRKDIKGLFVNFFTFIHRKQLDSCYKKFENFNYSEQDRVRRMPTYEELLTNVPDADAFITGSDQVFNPLLMNPMFFLDFVPNNVLRISYAASIGVGQIPIEKREQFKKYLSLFDSISVREEQAATIVKEVTGNECSVNIDPIFLVECQDWEKIEKEVDGISKPYILCYLIHRPKNVNSLLRKLKKVTGLEIVLVDTTAYRGIYCDKKILDAGPREFVWLIDHAEYVVTSSFHGSAFCIHMGKKFCVLNNQNNPDRIDNLLQIFNMQNHSVFTDKIPECLFQDFDASTSILREKKRALDYLERALSIKKQTMEAKDEYSRIRE